jgi:hypothetical protein
MPLRRLPPRYADWSDPPTIPKSMQGLYAALQNAGAHPHAFPSLDEEDCSNTIQLLPEDGPDLRNDHVWIIIRRYVLKSGRIAFSATIGNYTQGDQRWHWRSSEGLTNDDLHDLQQMHAQALTQEEEEILHLKNERFEAGLAKFKQLPIAPDDSEYFLDKHIANIHTPGHEFRIEPDKYGNGQHLCGACFTLTDRITAIRTIVRNWIPKEQCPPGKPYKKWLKYFYTGSSPESSSIQIGWSAGNDLEEVILCEGPATGFSIHHAVGIPVFCVGSCNNYNSVAEDIRQTFPKCRIIFASDYDQKDNGQNPGYEAALTAAILYGGKLCSVPPFIQGCKDFNDWAILCAEKPEAAATYGSIKEIIARATFPEGAQAKYKEYLVEFFACSPINVVNRKFLAQCARFAVLPVTALESEVSARRKKLKESSDKEEFENKLIEESQRLEELANASPEPSDGNNNEPSGQASQRGQPAEPSGQASHPGQPASFKHRVALALAQIARTQQGQWFLRNGDINSLQPPHGQFWPWYYDTLDGIKLRLRDLGFSEKRPDSPKRKQISPLEYRIVEAKTQNTVCYAGYLAGWAPGFHQLPDGGRILVTGTKYTPKPQEGDSKPIWLLLEAIFGADQALRYAFWLQFARIHCVSWQGLIPSYSTQAPWAPNLILIMIGEVNAGKSLIQEVITTPALGGYSNPWPYITGQTQFNGEFFHACHLGMQDCEFFTFKNFDTRGKIKASLKNLAFSSQQLCHPKGIQAVTLSPRWAISMSLNPAPEIIKSLPSFGPDFTDKCLVLKCFPDKLPGSRPEIAALLRAIHTAMPAFLYDVDHLELPAQWSHPRTGIAPWRNHEIQAFIEEHEPETAFLESIDATFFAASFLNTELKGKAAQISAILAPFFHDAHLFLPRLQDIGLYLSSLSRRFISMPNPRVIAKTHQHSTFFYIRRLTLEETT